MSVSKSLVNAREFLLLTQQELADLIGVPLLLIDLCENESTNFEALTEAQRDDFRKVVSVVKALCERELLIGSQLH
jgi:hypothetical protein